MSATKNKETRIIIQASMKVYKTLIPILLADKDLLTEMC